MFTKKLSKILTLIVMEMKLCSSQQGFPNTLSTYFYIEKLKAY